MAMAVTYFGQKVEEAIARAGLSVTELSRRTGIPQSVLSTWLNTHTLPRATRPDLDALAAALGVDPAEVREWIRLSWRGPGPVPQRLPEGLTELEAAVLQSVRALPPEIREPLLRGWLLTARGLLEQEARRGGPREAAGEPSLQEGPAPAPR